MIRCSGWSSPATTHRNTHWEHMFWTRVCRRRKENSATQEIGRTLLLTGRREQEGSWALSGRAGVYGAGREQGGRACHFALKVMRHTECRRTPGQPCVSDRWHSIPTDPRRRCVLPGRHRLVGGPQHTDEASLVPSMEVEMQRQPEDTAGIGCSHRASRLWQDGRWGQKTPLGNTMVPCGPHEGQGCSSPRKQTGSGHLEAVKLSLGSWNGPTLNLKELALEQKA